MEFKGTKGKWERIKVHKTAFIPERNEVCYGDDGECVAEFIENDYDALLISKAPEMLEMLKECMRVLRNVQSPATPAILLRREIEQLITQATQL